MRINRKELLGRLLSVTPGIARKETTQQSACVVLKRGRFYTLSTEVACSLTSGLTPNMEGAVKADKIIEMLRQMPEDELEVWVEAKTLYFQGKGRKARFVMEENIEMPIEEVELPKDWVPLHEDFTEAVDLVHRCTIKKEEYLKQCVHFHPQWLEASDDRRAIRYKIPTFVGVSVLVRGEAIKSIVQLGMTKGGETDNWLHFRNPMGLRVSVRKVSSEAYPPLDDFLNLRGQKIIFPKGLQPAALRAAIFEKDSVKITLSKEYLTVSTEKEGGGYEEEKRVKYSGPEMSFIVPPKLIAELVEKHNVCEVTPASLRVNGGKFVYCTVLEIKP